MTTPLNNHFGCRVGRQYPSSERQYTAAKSNRLTGDWIPINQDVNTLIRTSSAQIRARSRQLVRDFPFFARAVSVLTNFTVGSGIQFQSQVRKADNSFDKKICDQIEDAVKWGMDELDAGGRMHGHELERLCKRQDVEAGECLLVKVMLKDPNRYTPLAYIPYEPDWLSSVPEIVGAGNQFDQGIEYDPRTGKVIAYHFAVPTGYGYPYMTGTMNVQRIAASYVIHNYEMLRPAQLRGISPFTTAILIAHDLGDYLDATMDVAKLSAKYLAMVETTDAGGFQASRSVNGTGVDTGKKLESVENAIIEYLRPGEKIQFAKQDTMSDNFTPFTKFVLRMVAVATGVTYELLTSDYDGINYSTLRGIRNDFVSQIKPVQDRHIRHISQPVRLSIIDAAVQSGRLYLPGYQTNPYKYWKGAFTPPGMESPDPLREGKAWIEQIQYNLRSPQEVAAARGRNLEDILDEISEANRMMKDRDLTMGPVSTALQTNPAAVAPDTGDANA